LTILKMNWLKSEQGARVHAMLDGIDVNAYGARTPLFQVG
jgi:ribosome recycling factor